MLIRQTHQYLAHALEMDGSLRDAELHYIEASEWQSAVNMYRSNELWVSIYVVYNVVLFTTRIHHYWCC